MTQLSAEQAYQLEHVQGAQLDALREKACEVRDSHWGKVMTYSRKVFIPLTNMCRDECKYCTFVQRPESGNANIMTPAQVLTIVKQGQQMGCKEVLLSLGEKPELRYREARQMLAKLGFSNMIDYVVEICELILKETSLLPHVNAGTMDCAEFAKLKAVSASMGMMLETVSERLLEKGEAHFACPDKVPATRIATIVSAGQQQVPYTTGILVGIGETWSERVDSLVKINELHQQYGHIQEVIVQNFCAKDDTQMAEFPEPSLEDMLRTLAVARLILDPSISLQAPPNLQQRYKDYIASGINDWGGISPLTKDFINPERAWPQIAQLAQATKECGYQLQERLTAYPNYLSQAAYFEPVILQRLKQHGREDGLAKQQFIEQPRSTFNTTHQFESTTLYRVAL
jgi:FO synthase